MNYRNNKLFIFILCLSIFVHKISSVTFCDGIPFFSYVDPNQVTGYVEFEKGVPPYGGIDMEKAKRFANAVNDYHFIFPKATTSVILVPTTKADTSGPKYRTVLKDQKQLIDDVYSLFNPEINCINIFDVLAENIDDEVFFRYDHHWTAKGAYYAYKEFCKSNNLHATSLNDMEKKLLNSTWQGSYYKSTQDERIKYATDELYCYLPTKKHTMTYMDSSDNETYKFDTSIHTDWTSYIAFIGGDNPYTVIEVEDGPKDKCILVIKDSYGNAFVPYLCENYGSIVVVDPRFAAEGFAQTLKHTTKVSDVLICTALYQANIPKYIGQMENIIKGDIKRQKLINAAGIDYKKIYIKKKKSTKSSIEK